MTYWQVVDRPARRRIVRRAAAVATCLLSSAVCLLTGAPSEAHGLPTSGKPPLQDAQAVPSREPCDGQVETILRDAEALAEEGQLDAAEAILTPALDRCPHHPQLLGALAGIRFRQGRLTDAEALAVRLVRVDPGSVYGWDLLATTRYLQDDTHGALRAWSHGSERVVRDLEVRVLGHDGPRELVTGPDPARLTGLAEGRPLTVGRLVRGERRLVALPAAARARLEYRALPGQGASVEGTVVLRPKHPFTNPDLVAHAFRLLGRRVHMVAADPFGRLEQWELFGTIEGSLHRAGVALAHAAPGGFGVWRWVVDHEVGRYGRPGQDEAFREARTTVAWSHADWFTAALKGTAHARIDVRPGRGTFAGGGMAWALLPASARSTIGAEGTGWVRLGSAGDPGQGLPQEGRYGRFEVRGSVHTPSPESHATRTGLGVQGGVVAVSRGIAPDLVPRIGAGGNVSLLLRARSDLDGEGVVRPLFPGTAWAHVGVEVVRPVGSVGPVAIGVAAFADGVTVLSPDRRTADPSARRGAIHLGTGIRARIPWTEGWLRLDWGFDPADRGSTFSAAWVLPHRLVSVRGQ